MHPGDPVRWNGSIYRRRFRPCCHRGSSPRRVL